MENSHKDRRTSPSVGLLDLMRRSEEYLVHTGRPRDIIAENAKGDNEELGGLASNTQGITKHDFSGMLEILLVFHSPKSLTLAGADIVPKDGAELQPGKYYVDGKSKTLAHS